MAIYKTYHTIEIRTLEKELFTQFGIACGNLTTILFDDCYVNDCFKQYYFNEKEEYHGYPWEDEEHIRIRNMVNLYLKDTLPADCTSVLIDVSW